MGGYCKKPRCACKDGEVYGPIVPGGLQRGITYQCVPAPPTTTPAPTTTACSGTECGVDCCNDTEYCDGGPPAKMCKTKVEYNGNCYNNHESCKTGYCNRRWGLCSCNASQDLVYDAASKTCKIKP